MKKAVCLLGSLAAISVALGVWTDRRLERARRKEVEQERKRSFWLAGAEDDLDEDPDESLDERWPEAFR